MDLKEPKRKRWCNLELEQPFPIFIQSEIGVPIDNWVSFVYTGVFNGFSVVVKDPAEISALHSMGNFGKGNSSRSRPDIMRNNPKLPQIITKQQYIHRQQWAEKDKYNDGGNDSRNMQADELLEAIAELHTCIDNITSINTQLENDDIEETSSEKSEHIMNISSDEENYLNTTEHMKTSDGSSEPSVKKYTVLNANAHHSLVQDNNKNELSIEDLVFPLNSVVVLSDSDSEREDFLQCVKPKLCVDKSKNNEYLVLTLEEAYFLSYGLGCLQILDQDEKVLNLKESWKLFCETHKSFSSKYIVYHYYRSKGWIVKPAIKFGGDYLLYKEGQPYYHATYIALVDTSSTQSESTYDWKTVLGTLRMAGTAAKEVILTRVTRSESSELCDLSDDPSSITQYKVSEVLLRRWIPNHGRGDDDNC